MQNENIEEEKMIEEEENQIAATGNQIIATLLIFLFFLHAIADGALNIKRGTYLFSEPYAWCFLIPFAAIQTYAIIWASVQIFKK